MFDRLKQKLKRNKAISDVVVTAILMLCGVIVAVVYLMSNNNTMSDFNDKNQSQNMQAGILADKEFNDISDPVWSSPVSVVPTPTPGPGEPTLSNPVSTAPTPPPGANIGGPVQEKLTLTFYANGGLFSTGETVNVMTYKPINDRYVLQSGVYMAPTSDMAIFEGWYTTQECTPGTEYIFGSTLTTSLSVYAKWNKIINFAVFSADDNSLNFYTGARPAVGSMFDGRVVTETFVGFDEDVYKYSDAQGKPTTPWADLGKIVETVSISGNIQPKSTAYWFYGFDKVRLINLGSLDTSATINMSNMFNGVAKESSALTIGGLEYLRTSSVNDMSYMFANMGHGLDVFSLGDITTKKVIINGVETTAWDVASVANMSGMFQNAGINSEIFELDLSGWSNSGVNNAKDMFSGLTKLAAIRLPNTFKFNGTGSYLPTPSNAHILGATGLWYNTETARGFSPNNVPGLTAAKYTVFDPAYTVTYDAVEGTFISGKTNVVRWFNGQVVSGNIEEPTREHYVFIGWYTAVNGGEPFNSDELTGNTTVYAKYVREISPFAVYSADDNSLRIYYNRDDLTGKDTYNGRAVTALYKDIKIGGEYGVYANQNQVPWYSDTYYKQVKSVVFEDTIIPATDLSYYFGGMTNLTKVSVNGRTISSCVDVPDSLKEISAHMFENSGLTGTLNIPSHVTVVKESAFKGCQKLSGNLALHDNIKEIGAFAFDGAGFIGTLKMPANLERIQESAFNNVKFIGALAFPSKIQSIGNNAFNGTAFIGDLRIPDSLTSLGTGVFSNMPNINGTVTMSASISIIPAGLFTGTNNVKVVIVPATVTGMNTDANGSGFPSSSTGKWYSTTTGAQHTKDMIPMSKADTYVINDPSYVVTFNGNGGTFDDGTAINTTRYVNGHLMTGVVADPYRNGYVFSGWNSAANGSGNDIDVDNILTATTAYAKWTPINYIVKFHYNNTTSSLTVPFDHSNTDWNPAGFNVNGKENYKFLGWSTVDGSETPDLVPGVDNLGGLTTIAGSTINLYPVWKAYAPYAIFSETDNSLIFYYDAEEPTVGSTYNGRKVTTLYPNISTNGGYSASNRTPWYKDGNYAKMTSYSFHNPDIPITRMTHFFADCSALTCEITLPNHLETFGYSAFDGCSNLSGSITIPTNFTKLDDHVFRNCSKLSGTLVLHEGIKTIGQNTFQNCSGLTGNITFPSTLTSIGGSAFDNCSGLTGSLTFPESLISIGNNTFRNCTGITGSITMKKVATIGSEAFKNCSNATGTLDLGTNLVSIGNFAFANCGKLTGSITFPSTLEVLGAHAFEHCKGFTGGLIIPENITAIPEYAFRSCTGLNGTLTLPTTLLSIGNDAFEDCAGLNGALELPEMLRTIGANAFARCSGFTGNLTIPDTVQSIGQNAFVSCTGFSGTLTLPSQTNDYSAAGIFANINTFLKIISPAEVTTAPSLNTMPSSPSGKWFSVDGTVFNNLSEMRLNLPDTFYAYPEYTIEFGGGGAEGYMAPIATKYGQEVTLPESGFNRPGYNFTGWKLRGTESIYQPGTKVNSLSTKHQDTVYFDAQWATANITYTIEHKSTSGVVLRTQQITYKYGTENVVPTLSIPGYTAPATAPSFKWDSATPKTYTITYTPIVYKITYDYQDGVGYGKPSEFTIETETFSLVTPTKAGYGFSGWTGSNGDTPAVSVTIAKGSIGDRHYVANWGAVGYRVIDGDTGATVAEFTAETPTFTIPAPSDIPVGQVFMHWNKSADGSGAIVTEVAQGTIGDVVVYKQLSFKTLRVTYHKNDGSGQTKFQDFVYGASDKRFGYYSNGVLIWGADGQFGDWDRTGYTLLGWSATLNGSKVWEPYQSIDDAWVNANYPSINAYAVWQIINYNIKFNLPSGATIEGATPTSYNVESARITLPTNVTRKGYTFEGWYTNKACTGTAVKYIATGSTGNKEYWPKWTLNAYSYDIVHKSTTGTVLKTETLQRNFGDAVTVSPISKNGYTAPSEVGVLFDEIYKEIVLTYTPIQYTITYNYNGGTVTGTNPTKFTVESAAFTLKQPTKAGYEFVNWTMSGPAGDGIYNTVTVAKGSTGNRTYTANWRDITPPTITDVYPPISGDTNYTNGGTIIITGKVQDNEGIGDLIVTVNGQEVEVDENGNFTYEGPAPSGSGNFEIVATDKAGNSDDAPVTIVGDREAPVFSGTIPERTQYPTLILEGLVTDNFEVDFVKVNGKEVTLDSEQRFSETIDLAIGTNTITVIARDKAGNEITEELTIEYDPYVTVTYGANGGTFNGNETNDVTYWVQDGHITSGSYIEPTRTGYEFAGWYKEPNCYPGNEFDITTDITRLPDDYNLYAKWEIKEFTYTVVRKSTTGKEISRSDLIGSYGESRVISPGAVKGYFTPADQTVVWDTEGNKEIVFTYEPIIYNITYELDGGVNSASNPATYTVEDANFVLRDASKTGHTFKGWKMAGDNVPYLNLNVVTSYAMDRTFTATFVANKYAYTVNCVSTSGQTIKTYTVEQPFGTTMKINPTDIAGYTKPAAQTIVWDALSKTITFTYTPIVYNITYSSTIGGLGSNRPSTYTVETETFVIENMAELNYSFLGWKVNGSSVPVRNYTVEKGSTGDLSLIAAWSDSAAPLIIWLEPSTRQETAPYKTNNPTLVITGTVSDNEGAENLAVTAGTSSTTPNADGDFSLTYTLTEGLNEITVKATDKAGNFAEDTIYVRLDTTPPVITAEYPSETDALELVITGTVTDENGVVSFKLNADEWNHGDDKFECIEPIKGLYGTNTFVLRAEDSFGNVSTKDVTFVRNVDFKVTYLSGNGKFSNGTTTNVVTYHNGQVADGTEEIPSGDGITFNRWRPNIDGDYRIFDIHEWNSDVEAIAMYDNNTYAITYELDCGCGCGVQVGTLPTEYTYGLIGKTINVTPTCNNSIHTFIGWTGSNGTTPEKTVHILSTDFGDKHYVANWVKTQYTYNVRYMSESGKQLGNQEITHDASTTHIITPPDFAGYVTPASQEVVWDAANKVIEFTYDLIDYTITYDLDGGEIPEMDISGDVGGSTEASGPVRDISTVQNSEYSLFWNGNTEGMTPALQSFGGLWYKLSDKAPSAQELDAGYTFTLSTHDGNDMGTFDSTSHPYIVYPVTADASVLVIADSSFATTGEGVIYVAIVPEDIENASVNDTTFSLEKGTYLLNINEQNAGANQGFVSDFKVNNYNYADAGESLIWNGDKGGLNVVEDVLVKVSDSHPYEADLAYGFQIKAMFKGVETTFNWNDVTIYETDEDDDGVIDCTAFSYVTGPDDHILAISVHQTVEAADSSFAFTPGLYFIDGDEFQSSNTQTFAFGIQNYTGLTPAALLGVGDALGWIGNTDGLETLENILYKVSSEVPSREELLKGWRAIASFTEYDSDGAVVGDSFNSIEVNSEMTGIEFVPADEGLPVDMFVFNDIPAIMLVHEDITGDITLSKGTYLLNTTIPASLTGADGAVETQIYVSAFAVNDFGKYYSEELSLIYWDGIIDPDTAILVDPGTSDPNEWLYMQHVYSGTPPTADEIGGTAFASISVVINGLENNYMGIYAPIDMSLLTQVTENIYSFNDAIIFAYEDEEFNGMQFKKGIYFLGVIDPSVSDTRTIGGIKAFGAPVPGLFAGNVATSAPPYLTLASKDGGIEAPILYHEDATGTAYYVKVSDIAPSMEALSKGVRVEFAGKDSATDPLQTQVLDYGEYDFILSDNGKYASHFLVFVVYETTALETNEDVVLTPGTYFGYTEQLDGGYFAPTRMQVKGFSYAETPALENPTQYNIESATITLLNPEKEGYDFAGWTGSNGSEAQMTATIPTGSTGDKEFTANWEKSQITVTYDANGGNFGSGVTTNAVEYKGITVVDGEYKEPTRMAHQFLGWYTDAECTAGKEFNLSGNSEDITVYAKWEEVYPVLRSWASSSADDFHNGAYKSKITTAEIVDYAEIPESPAAGPWDVSEKKNGSVMAWLTTEDGGTTYHLTISGNGYGKVFANENSSYVFSNFTMLSLISGADKLETGGLKNSDNFWAVNPTTNMSYMFNNTGSSYSASKTFAIVGLNNWDTSNVTNMNYMFNYVGRYATTWSIGDLSNWNVKNVKSFSNTFCNAGYYATAWDIGNLNNWDVSSATAMNAMFASSGYKATSWNIGDLSNWNVSTVTDMGTMFNEAGYKAVNWNIGNLNNWNVSQVKKMDAMFASAGHDATTWNVGNLSNWNVSNVQKMNYMFSEAGYSATTWDIGKLDNWLVNNVNDMSYMFNYSGYKESDWNVGNLNSWNVSNVKNMRSMFAHAGYNATAWNAGDLSNWNVSTVTNFGFMFSSAGYSSSVWNIGQLNKWNLLSATSTRGMFTQAGHGSPVLNVDYTKNWNFTNVTDVAHMFANCHNLKEIDITQWDLNKVDESEYMFEDCLSLKELTIPASLHVLQRNFASGCTSLTNITFNHTNSDLIELPESGYIKSQTLGAFYVGSPYGSSNLLMTNLTTENDTVKAYLWNADNRGFPVNVIYNANGGDFDGAQQENNVTYAGSQVLTGTYMVPVRTAHEFLGWYTDAECSDGKEFNLSATSQDIAVYAKWEPIYPVLANSRNTTSHFRDSAYANYITTAEIVDYEQTPESPAAGPWDISEEQNGSVMAWLTSEDEGTTYHLTISGNGYGKVFANEISAELFGNDDVTSKLWFNNLTSINGLDILELRGLKDENGAWLVKPVKDMSGMFANTRNLKTIDVSAWDVSSVTNMSNMFSYTESLTSLDVNDWDVSSVTNMNKMFYNSGLTTIDVSNWDASSVKDMSYMFACSRSLTTVDTSNWDVSSVTNMRSMFHQCSKLKTLDASSWDTSSVTNMKEMFASCESLYILGVSNWDVSSVTDMSSMFYKCDIMTLDVGNWDVSSVTTMYQMFTGCEFLTNLDVSKWDVSSVTSMGGMFDNCVQLENLNVSKWDVSSVANMSNMFDNCRSLTTAGLGEGNVGTKEVLLENGTKYVAWDTSSVISMNTMFANCSDITSLDVSNWDVSSVTNMGGMFTACRITSLDVSNWDVSSVTSMNGMFAHCSSMTSLDVSNWDVSSVTGMHLMFYSCDKLETLDVSKWDVSSVTDISSMFADCISITSLDVSKWNTKSLKSIGGILTQQINNPEVGAFYNCKKLSSIDTSKWDLSNVSTSEDAAYVFYGCSSLKELTIPSSLAYIGTKFAAECPLLKDITFLHDKDVVLTLPTAGSSTGAFYTGSSLATNINTSNDLVLGYAWSTDRRSITSAGISGITITYDANGGSFINDSTINNVKYKLNSDLIMAGKYVEPTYKYGTKTFAGWFADAECTIPFDVTATIADTTVYAKWNDIQFTVTYDANDGMFGTETTNSVSYLIDAGTFTKISKTDNVSDDGSTYGAGYADNLNAVDVISIPGAESLEVTVTYQTQKDTASEYLAIYDGSIKPTSTNISSSIPGKKLGGTTKTTATYTIPGDTVQFYFKSYNPPYNYYGYYATITGVGRMANQTTDNYAIPTRDGYEFAGWYTDAACTDGNEFDVNNSLSDVTVYAKWNDIQFTVTYDANGGAFGTEATNLVSYLIGTGTVTKISKTDNVSDDGLSYGSGYAANLETTDTVTIPGAKSLEVSATYQTQGISYDWFAVYDGSVTPTSSTYGRSIAGKKLAGTKKTTVTYTVLGDTVQFYFKSNGSSNKYYGYYATITGVGKVANPTTDAYATPTKDGYEFAGWYTSAACTDGNEFDVNTITSDTTVYAKWI